MSPKILTKKQPGGARSDRLATLRVQDLYLHPGRRRPDAAQHPVLHQLVAEHGGGFCQPIPRQQLREGKSKLKIIAREEKKTDKIALTKIKSRSL